MVSNMSKQIFILHSQEGNITEMGIHVNGTFLSRFIYLINSCYHMDLLSGIATLLGNICCSLSSRHESSIKLSTFQFR